MASSFEKYLNLKKPPVFVLKGKIPPKYVPNGWLQQDLEVDPEEVNTPLTDLIFPGNFRRMIESPFDLPDEVEDGAIHITQQGMLFVGINGSWVMFGSAIAKYK